MSEFTGDFALVCEGPTDYAVIKNILIGFFKGQREPLVQQVQPDIRSKDNWQHFGSWENVFRYLETGKHRQALQFNRFLIIQLDTDVSQEPNFGVPHFEKGLELKPEVLASRVTGRVREKIGAADCANYGDRIIFAVCVHSLECWLLPLWESGKKRGKVTGCLQTLNAALARKNERTINPDDKDFLVYQSASRGYKKHDTLLDSGIQNPSLKLFLDELSKRNIALMETGDS